MGALYCEDKEAGKVENRAREFSKKMARYGDKLLDLTYPHSAMFTGALEEGRGRGGGREGDTEGVWIVCRVPCVSVSSCMSVCMTSLIPSLLPSSLPPSSHTSPSQEEPSIDSCKRPSRRSRLRYCEYAAAMLECFAILYRPIYFHLKCHCCYTVEPPYCL